MKRWIPVILCLLLPATGASAQTTMEWMVLSVQWGNATSQGDMRASGLPSIQSAREAARRLDYRRTIVLHKPADGASRMLRQAQTSGRVLPRVVIRARDRKGKPAEFVLLNVRIRNISRQQRNSAGIAVERVELAVEKIHRAGHGTGD